MNNISLKYRIALIIFILEAIMIGLVLWQTQNLLFNATNSQLETHEQVMLNLVGNLSRFALINEEYAELQPYVEDIQQDPNVIEVLLFDYQDRLVVSTEPSLLGEKKQFFPKNTQKTWNTKEISLPSGHLGILAIQFSNANLREIYKDARNLGIKIALTSMVTIALVGVLIGHLLTRRLQKLTLATKCLTDGDMNIKINMSGSDEIANLSNNFEVMAQKLATNINELKKSERHLRNMIEKSPLPMVVTDDNQDITIFNDKFTELFGYTLEDVSTAEKWWEICYPDEDYRNLVQQSWMDAIEKAQSTNTDIERQEWEWTIKGGSKRLCEYFMVPLSGSSLIIMNDITEKKRKDDQIKASLKEKETLLQEIHHRVKNNMQVISSLLKLQSNNIENDQIKEVLKESQSRVYAMSAVHEILHGSENLSEIDLKGYLPKITDSIFQTYSVNPDKVVLNTDVEKLPIGINQASPLGLIINELITNSLKYAFPDKRKGEITVSMKRLGKELELSVMDNGVGMPDNLDWKNSNTLGLKLVRTLVENQLDGSIDMESNNGTKFTIKLNIIS
jgi:PAS domain S-box-containing protein